MHFRSGLRTDDEALISDVYSFWRQNSLLGFENERKISILFAIHGIDSLAESSVIDSFFPLFVLFLLILVSQTKIFLFPKQQRGVEFVHNPSLQRSKGMPFLRNTSSTEVVLLVGSRQRLNS